MKELTILVSAFIYTLCLVDRDAVVRWSFHLIFVCGGENSLADSVFSFYRELTRYTVDLTHGTGGEAKPLWPIRQHQFYCNIFEIFDSPHWVSNLQSLALREQSPELHYCAIVVPKYTENCVVFMSLDHTDQVHTCFMPLLGLELATLYLTGAKPGNYSYEPRRLIIC